MGGGKNSECVKVVVRCRPMSGGEIADGRKKIVFMDKKNAMAVLNKPEGSSKDSKDFTYDAVYDDDSTQQQIYEETASGIVESVMEGYNGTIFAYGQTGAGKTHTMAGPSNADQDSKGLLPRAFDHIFNDITVAKPDVQRFLVRASFLEIYNEEIRDLLSKDPKERCELKEHPNSGVYVKDLNAFVVKSVDEISQVLAAGIKNRSTGATLMNVESSRSHSIFTVTVETADVGSEDGHIRVGKLNMVDLAGSERQSKTGATGDRLKEATKINLSLSALGNVISSLVDGHSSHIPYRDSKLTRLLQDSLGGNTKTMMVANCGPADYNFEETLSTLRYAYRAKSIKNKPRINEDPKDAMIREFQDEIKRLKEELMAQSAAVHQSMTTAEGGVMVVEKEVVKEVIKEVNTMDLTAMESKLRDENENMKKSLETQRQNIEAQRDMAEAEKANVLSELKLKEEAVRKAQADQDHMLQRLKFMGEKMLQGSQVIEKAMIQEQELRKAKQAEAETMQAEQRAREAARLEVERREILQQQCESQEEHANKLTKKLETLWTKYQKARQEIEDVSEEFQTDKLDMMNTIRSLYKELEYKNMILENFVPHEDQNRFLERCVWNENDDEWVVTSGNAGQIDSLDAVKARVRATFQRPKSVHPGAPRPITEYARNLMRMGDVNPRFRYDNILVTDLEMPERQTMDFDENMPQYDPKIEKFLTLAFADEDFESVTTLGGGNLSGPGGGNLNMIDQSHNHHHGDKHWDNQHQQYDNTQAFPQARGLVQRGMN